MKVEVQFFSRLRDVVRASTLSVDLPADACLGDLLDQLYRDHPGLAAWDTHLLLAIGLDYAERDQKLREGNDVSVMPPVQGG